MIRTLDTPQAMQGWADRERAAGRRIALVPTMGALHAGHEALIAEAKARGDVVVVSIFVNPIQFNRREDFDRYPRPMDADVATCVRCGVDAVYAPGPAAMYPEGFYTGVEVARLTEPLCGAGRPGHFRGVTTVVTKLFHAVRPHVALFGEKDFQQLAVIRRMTADLDFGIEIVGVPTVREDDGVALSSRNALLTPDGRVAARCVPAALDAAAAALARGERASARVCAAAHAVVDDAPLARLEYVECRDPNTLEEVAVVEGPTLVAICVWIDEVRLIDNRVLDHGRTNHDA